MKLKTFVKRAVRAIVPYGILAVYRRYKTKQKIKKLYGGYPKSYCPVCENTSYFWPFGNPPRQKACCTHCESVERHRLEWLFFKKNTDLFDKGQKKVLHVAAERCFEKRLKKTFGKNYITADLYNPDAMIKMDITQIQYPDESFDIILCSHVLEHIPDDQKAMRELYRVLKKEGWAVVLVPIADMEKTYEDFSIITEAGRLKAFGQSDHVRKYGIDYSERLKSAGFNVTVFKQGEIACAEEIESMRLKEDSELWGFVETEIFYCTKQIK
jgi:predicted SAM-dependent methyltransferase